MAKELDFDELDKAVTSLMGGVKDPDPGATEKHLDINATLAPGEAPSYNRLHSVAKSIGSETIDNKEQTVSLTPSTQEPAPTETPQKRSGRFMDVVHPSSDMRIPSPKKVSREGVAIAPATSTPPINSDSPLPDTTAGNLPVDSAKSPADQGDTRDIQDGKESGQSDTPEASAPVNSEEVTPTASGVAQVEPPSQPLTSPFLPDAKVEKRPLGGEPNLSAQSQPTPADTPASVAPLSELPSLEEHEISAINAVKANDEFSKMDAMAEPAQNLEEVNEHIPEEYQNELLAVEKNIAAQAPDATYTESETSIATPVAAPVMASIPKQYQEKPSSSDATNGSIYDTDQYHKPLAHPAKEKSGWTWVIAIVVLILLGAGLGAAAYYLGLV